MKNAWIVMLLAIAGAVSTGCNKPEEATAAANQDRVVGLVAVVDLDEVAKKLGKTEKWERELSDARKAFASQLQQKKEALQKQLAEQEKALGETPSDEDKAKLRSALLAANQQLAADDRELATRWQQQRATLVSNFRQQMEALTLKVAKAKGFTVVVTKTPTMLACDPSADITQAVLEAAIDAKIAENAQ